MTASADVLRELASTPLLGDGAARVEALCSALAAQLAVSPDREISRRLLAVTGGLLLSRGDPTAAARLAEAARRAEQAGDATEATRLRLLAARSLMLHGAHEAAREQLDAVTEAARSIPELGADWRLAEAAAGHPDARVLWLEALPHLHSPARDHDRVEALLCLGLGARNGGNSNEARVRWEAALALAEAWRDDRATLHLSALLGNLLLEVGLPVDAEAHLRRAVETATSLDDPLTVIAEGTLLAAVQLARGDWSGAEETGLLLADAAERRNHWLAMADAAIILSTATQGRGHVEPCVALLLRAAQRLNAAGATAAVNILRARLGELRVEMTPEIFDPLLRTIAARLPRR